MNPSPEPGDACGGCGRRHGGRRFTARERMFGTLEHFEYEECGACGTLRIVPIPGDLERHYPPDYHAYAPPDRAGRFRGLLKRLRGEHAFAHRNPLGALVARVQGEPVFFDWMRRARCRIDSRVLDAGCGAGHLLLEMHAAGFRNLTGADPFLPREASGRRGLRFVRHDLDGVEGVYDLVMMHHAFEHVPHPLTSLRQVRRLLAPGGSALIRIPVAGSFAWRTYGEHWAQLDAPRHLHLHTERGFQALAARAGFEVAEVVYDSGGFQFWASELYVRGIPMVDRGTGRAAEPTAYFTPAELKAFEAHALELNMSRDGDAAAYYLRPTARP